MSDHLPECPWADRGFAFPCICDRLRACEKRVRKNAIETIYEAQKESYVRGVDAAREAVEAVDPPSEAYDDWHPKGKRLALSAIDTLREETK